MLDLYFCTVRYFLQYILVIGILSGHGMFVPITCMGLCIPNMLVISTEDDWVMR